MWLQSKVGELHEESTVPHDQKGRTFDAISEIMKVTMEYLPYALRAGVVLPHSLHRVQSLWRGGQ